MVASDSRTAWGELRELVGASTRAHQKSKDFWEEMFGAEGAVFCEAEGNERTDRFCALLERVDQTTHLAERVAVLERLAVQDEARIAPEIERTSHIERLCSERRI